MRILLTNDDGIQAPGLWEAARALRQVGEVFVVAPHREQSGVGTSLTLRTPLRATPAPVDPSLSGGGAPHPVTAYAVEGTPGDSCVLGLEKVVGAVDLVVSGINAGSNLGWDVVVSGTVGAAVQGYVRGFHTIAISVGAVRNPIYDGARRLLRLVAQRLTQAPPEDPLFLNINVPNLPLKRVSGLRVTRLGGRSYREVVTERGAGPGQRYWIDRNLPATGEAPAGTDIWAMKNNLISVTPLRITLGDQDIMPDVESLLEGIFAQSLTTPD